MEGSYVFSLVVNDGQDNSTPDTVTINVPLLGDIDLDGDVDKNDLKLLKAAKNKKVTVVNDLRDLNGDGIVDQSELNAVLANYWLHSPWIYMTNATSLGGGMFQFALTNASAWNFTVLGSSNFTDWTSLPGPAYPVYQFFDPEAASNATMRVYRMRWP